MQSATCSQRLNRDVAELFSSCFNCSASHLVVIQSADSLNEPGSITLDNQVFEGPYRGGRFSFCFHIPANYPFHPVEVWATHPIWHPNIDLRSGKVAIPLEWSPVLTLNSFALAVQMLMLEPSSENPLNIEAYSLYMTQPAAFDNFAQNSLRGGWINNVHFPNVCISNVEMNAALQINSAIGKRDASSLQSYAPIQIPTPSKRTRMQIEEDDEADSDSTHSSSQQYSSRETSLNSAKRGRVTPFFEDSNPQNIFVACSKLSLHQSSDPFPKILTSNGGVAPAIPHDGSSQVAMSFSP